MSQLHDLQCRAFSCSLLRPCGYTCKNTHKDRAIEAATPQTYTEWTVLITAYVLLEIVNSLCWWNSFSTINVYNFSSVRVSQTSREAFISDIHIFISMSEFLHHVARHMCSFQRRNITCKIKGIRLSSFFFPDVFKMFSTTVLQWLCPPKPSHKYTSFQFSFLGLFIKIDFFTRLHSLLAWTFPFGFPQGCLFKSVSTILFPALPLHLLKLLLVHLEVGRHPKYAEV